MSQGTKTNLQPNTNWVAVVSAQGRNAVTGILKTIFTQNKLISDWSKPNTPRGDYNSQNYLLGSEKTNTVCLFL